MYVPSMDYTRVINGQILTKVFPGTAAEFPNMNMNMKWMNLAAYSIATVVDMVLTGTFVAIMRQCRTGFKGTDAALRLLARYAMFGNLPSDLTRTATRPSPGTVTKTPIMMPAAGSTLAISTFVCSLVLHYSFVYIAISTPVTKGKRPPQSESSLPDDTYCLLPPRGNGSLSSLAPATAPIFCHWPVCTNSVLAVKSLPGPGSLVLDLGVTEGSSNSESTEAVGDVRRAGSGRYPGGARGFGTAEGTSGAASVAAGLAPPDVVIDISRANMAREIEFVAM
ncbi:hypothetical protein GSI_05610 [Ganoderma sinense ZZ0214-1]|uniref:Uncharacterized protein n=1 Tax=Ganoderma sinense ZZ0214-1 TaxID=1077348 RepID=A0A2G8SF07_9APHY|nr:hypothetical protein GSI_05610 [Ganoderma sinense ZZ0214-1]